MLARNESERDSAGRMDEPITSGEVQHRNPPRGWRQDDRNRNVHDQGRPHALQVPPKRYLEPRSKDLTKVEELGCMRSQSGS